MNNFDGFNLNHGESLFSEVPVRLTPKEWRSIFVVAREEIAERLGNTDILVYTFKKADGQTILRIEPVLVEHEELHTDIDGYDE
jgi:hypothetical protein